MAAKKNGIHIKPSHRGLFTKKAKAAGMTVTEFAEKSLRKGSKASAATRKQANFARNERKWKH